MSANDEQQQLEEFVALLATLPDDERYGVAIEMLEIFERHSGEAKAE